MNNRIAKKTLIHMGKWLSYIAAAITTIIFIGWIVSLAPEFFVGLFVLFCIVGFFVSWYQEKYEEFDAEAAWDASVKKVESEIHDS